MSDPKDTVIRYKVPEHVRRLIWDLATEEGIEFQEMALHLIVDGLKQRLVSRKMLLDSQCVTVLVGLQGNSR